PPIRRCSRTRVSRFEPNWRNLAIARTRIASPSVLAPHRDLSVRFCRPSAPAVSDRWPARCQDGLARSRFTMTFGFVPSEIPTRASKGIISAHHRFSETREDVPTNWAGTPDKAYLDLYTCFAKGILVKFPIVKCDRLPVSEWCWARTGSEFPPSPQAPWSRKWPLY